MKKGERNSGRKASRLEVGVPVIDVYEAAAHTVNPLDTLNQKPIDPSPLHSSAFISPTNASDQYSHMFGTPSQQLPVANVMGDGFEAHEPHVMFPDMSSTIAASSSSLEKRLTPATMKTTTFSHQSQTPAVNGEVAREADIMRSHVLSRDGLNRDEGHAQPSATNVESNAAEAEAPTNAADTNHRQAKKRKAEAEIAGPDLSSALWVGLPKEKYKPRPSRSRSAVPSQVEPLASLESTSSGRSRKIRRSRTGGSAVGGISNETTQILVGMGFSSADAEAALVETDWVFDRALDLLTERRKSKSRSPEAVRSVAKPMAEHEIVKEPLARNEGTVVIYTSPLRGDDAETVTRINEAQPERASKLAKRNAPEEHRNTHGLSTATSHTELDASSNTHINELSQSPSSTKGKRLKRTKTGNKSKQQAHANEQGQPIDEHILRTKDAPTSQHSNMPAEATQNGKKLSMATEEAASIDSNERAQEESQGLQPRTEDVSAPPPKLEHSAVQAELHHEPSKSSTDEVIEIDDDSDGPPIVSKKLRRLKTAPAAVLKKEKKKKKGKPKKDQKSVSEEKVIEDELDQPKADDEETREVLQKVDGNTGVIDEKAANAEAEDAAPAKSKKADSKAAKKGKATAKSAKTIRDTPEIDEDEEKEQSEEAKTPKAANSVSKATNKNQTPEPAQSADEMQEDADNNGTKISEKENEVTIVQKEVKKSEKKPHSPIKRVPYRVGLSKRTRIEPLLKMRR